MRKPSLQLNAPVLMTAGATLTLAKSQNASDFDNLRVRKTSTGKRLRVRIIHVSPKKGKNLLVVSTVCQWKKNLISKTFQVH